MKTHDLTRILILSCALLFQAGCSLPGNHIDTESHVMLDSVLQDWLKRSPNMTRAEPRVQPGEVVTLLTDNLPAGYIPAETEPKVVVVPRIIRYTPQEKATIRIDHIRYPVAYHVLSVLEFNKGFRKTRIVIGDNIQRPGAGSQSTYNFRKKDGNWELVSSGAIVLR